MAKFAEVFAGTADRPLSPKVKTQKVRYIHYSKLVSSPYQYRNRDINVVKKMADLIKLDGEILEPCVIRKAAPSGDQFELISGHKRMLAVKYLVEEEHLEEFALIPCIEKTITDVRTEFATYSSNNHDEKTPYEIMCEIEGMHRLLKEHPEEFPEFAGKGAMVEKLASQMNMARSVVSDYRNIAKNLGEKGMESFEKGEIDKSAAVTLASVPEEQQEEILENGLKTRKEIRTYLQKQVREPVRDKEGIQRAEEEEQLPGQMNVEDYPELLPREDQSQEDVDESTAQEETFEKTREKECEAAEESNLTSPEVAKTYGIQDVQRLYNEAVLELEEYKKANHGEPEHRIPEATMKKKEIYVDALHCYLNQLQQKREATE